MNIIKSIFICMRQQLKTNYLLLHIHNSCKNPICMISHISTYFACKAQTYHARPNVQAACASKPYH